MTNRSLILMYHRIAEPAADPWALTVAPRRFAEHLEALKAAYSLLSVYALGQDVSSGSVPRQAVAISFDDGYADNYLNAAPMLEKCGVPATVFVASGAIAQRREFWWDELQQLILGGGTLPDVVSVRIRGAPRSWRVRPWREAPDLTSMRAWEGPADSPMALYRELWEAMRPLTAREQQAVLAELRSLFGREPGVRPTHRAMTAEELRALSRSGVIEIGAHTVNHPTLPCQRPDEQRWEIETGKRQLEELVDREVRCFAYPFGDHDRVSVRLVREAGFACACTTAERSVSRRTDPFRMPRLAVEDWDAEELLERLRGWLGRPRS